jgi:hypothetical protein
MKSGKVCFGAVRHSGYDVVEFFTKDNIKDIPFDHLWGKYLEWRRKDMDGISLASEISNTDFDGGVFFDFKTEPTETNPEKIFYLCYDAGMRYVRRHTTQAYEDGYECSYGDYNLLITYDANGVLESCLQDNGNPEGWVEIAHQEEPVNSTPSFADMLNCNSHCGFGCCHSDQSTLTQGTIVKIGAIYGWDVNGKVCGANGMHYIVELLTPVDGYEFSHATVPAFICKKAGE